MADTRTPPTTYSSFWVVSAAPNISMFNYRPTADFTNCANEYKPASLDLHPLNASEPFTATSARLELCHGHKEDCIFIE